MIINIVTVLRGAFRERERGGGGGADLQKGKNYCHIIPSNEAHHR